MQQLSLLAVHKPVYKTLCNSLTNRDLCNLRVAFCGNSDNRNKQIRNVALVVLARRKVQQLPQTILQTYTKQSEEWALNTAKALNRYLRSGGNGKSRNEAVKGDALVSDYIDLKLLGEYEQTSQPLIRLVKLKEPDLKQVLEELAKEHVWVHAADGEGKTALHRALARNHIEIAKILIERGADVTLINRRDRLPLLISAYDKRCAALMGEKAHLTEEINGTWWPELRKRFRRSTISRQLRMAPTNRKLSTKLKRIAIYTQSTLCRFDLHELSYEEVLDFCKSYLADENHSILYENTVYKLQKRVKEVIAIEKELGLPLRLTSFWP